MREAPPLDDMLARCLRALLVRHRARGERARAVADFIRRAGSLQSVGLYDVVREESRLIAWSGQDAPPHAAAALAVPIRALDGRTVGAIVVEGAGAGELGTPERALVDHCAVIARPLWGCEAYS